MEREEFIRYASEQGIPHFQLEGADLQRELDAIKEALSARRLKLSPLIALVRIGRLDLVPTILASVLIPSAVAREIRPSIAVLPHWMEVRAKR
jgi:hypothetical protein